MSDDRQHEIACLRARVTMPLLHGENALLSYDRYQMRAIREDIIIHEHAALVEGAYYYLFLQHALHARGFSVRDIDVADDDDSADGGGSSAADGADPDGVILQRQAGARTTQFAVPRNAPQTVGAGAVGSDVSLSAVERKQLRREADRDAMFCLIAKGDGRVHEIVEKFGRDWAESVGAPVPGAAEVWKSTLPNRMAKEREDRRKAMKSEMAQYKTGAASAVAGLAGL
jgi:hypothetical protein